VDRLEAEIERVVQSDPQYASAVTAFVASDALAPRKIGIDKIILSAGKQAYSKAADPNGHKAAKKLLKNIGIS